jgi:surface protein/uncharacterized repeat protein (TIGR03803 family)
MFRNNKKIFFLLLLVLLGASLSLGAHIAHATDYISGAFVTTWKTNNPGTSESNQITIPTYTYGNETYNYNVDWGDGNSETISNDTPPTHTYTTPGTYIVQITGTFPSIYFHNGGDRQKILSVEQWGTIHWNSMHNAFSNASNLVVNATDVPDLSNVTDMSGMFAQATSFNQDISSWDVSHVTNMFNMFAYASSFNQDISSWDVSHVTAMNGMFFNVTLSTSNYDALLNAWSFESLRPNVTFDGGNSKYSSCSETQRANIISNYDWTITDGGLDSGPITCIPTLYYSGNLHESISDDGSVVGSRVISLINDTFVTPLALTSEYTLSPIPAGLTPVMTVSGDGTTATLTFTGTATSSTPSDNVSNLTITFLDGAFTSTEHASDVANHTNNTGTITFRLEAAPTYTDLIDLTGVDGDYPGDSSESPMLLNPADGTFYGVTFAGGASDNGVFYNYDPSTNTYTDIFDFTGDSGDYSGKEPEASLALHDNKIYGMTDDRNANYDGYGNIFEYNLGTHTYTNKINFTGIDGDYPGGKNVWMNGMTYYNGFFYGLTALGGANDAGVLFKWNPVSNTYIDEHDFTSGTGMEPFSSLTLVGDMLYGVTQEEDMTYSGKGVLFSYNPSTDTYSDEIHLTGVDGDYPGSSFNGSLLNVNGILYGAANMGGSTDAGVLFSWDPDTNAYTNLYEFEDGDEDGYYPVGPLSLGPDGKIYGMTWSGGEAYSGVIFQWDMDTSTYTNEYEFLGTDGGGSEGTMTLGYDNKFYETTDGYGANGYGNVFSFTMPTWGSYKTLSGIAITHPANKLSYSTRDTLDITGLEVTGTYSDASS